MAAHRVNWIEHNRALLEQEYEGWVVSCAQYNAEQQALYQQQQAQVQPGQDQQIEECPQYITDVEIFRQTYTPEYFFDMQYNQYGAQQFAEQQPVPEEPDPAQTQVQEQ